MSFFFFFSSRRRHTRSTRDWSSDVCSSDLRGHAQRDGHQVPRQGPGRPVPADPSRMATEEATPTLSWSRVRGRPWRYGGPAPRTEYAAAATRQPARYQRQARGCGSASAERAVWRTDIEPTPGVGPRRTSSRRALDSPGDPPWHEQEDRIEATRSESNSGLLSISEPAVRSSR